MINKNRYKRHLMLPEVGEEGQHILADSKVLVVGAGGLGSPVLMYLAAAGVGTLGIADFDLVDESNLQRQILYRESDIGTPKVEAAASCIRQMNSLTKVICHPQGIRPENALEIISQYDLVVDASDNFPTRYLISDTCVQLKKPEIYGAICEFAGQVTVFTGEGPCLRCLCPEAENGEEPKAGDYGVLGVVPGVFGCLQAAEALKVLLAMGKPLKGRMIFLDLLTMQMDEMELEQNPRCPVCS